MAIDREKALGADLGETTGSYGPDDVILYHLGIGAGFRATDPDELAYTFEKNLKVLPSFSVVASSGMTARARRTPDAAGNAGLGNVPGLSFNTALQGLPELGMRVPADTLHLHVLCWFGIVSKAIVDAGLGGDPTRVARYSVRYAGVAFPAETLRATWWRENRTLLVDVQSAERGA